MVSGLSRDKGSTMTETPEVPEPPATPWPKHDRRIQHEAWPPELDESTWEETKIERTNEE